jgi:hypothetical protein
LVNQQEVCVKKWSIKQHKIWKDLRSVKDSVSI